NMPSKRKINVLIVDDSVVSRALLTHILESDKEIEESDIDINIMGTAVSGEDALKFLQTHKPDIILMDVCMPGMTGFETTRRIMEQTPLPIIIVTSIPDIKSSRNTFKMMEAGALAIMAKPPGPGHPDYPLEAKAIRETVRVMSEVKVIKRWAKTTNNKEIHNSSDKTKSNSQTLQSTPKKTPNNPKNMRSKIVVIGVSTGGPPVLKTILSMLPINFLLPVVIVQHIAPGFLDGMVSWLSQTSTLPIHIPNHGETVLPGHVYFAPDKFNMEITEQRIIMLNKDNHKWNCCPSVSCLFMSVLKNFGSSAVGVILTGMGEDGAAELLSMKHAGSITITQNQSSCVVFGMPGKAVSLGAATYILPPDEIAQKLIELARNA
ncbi:MAG: chemotaxis protein CheB, partial [Desulfamplus sp.]|nr:chemotaxis protein CheB [Desulfamplus sp.]